MPKLKLKFMENNRHWLISGAVVALVLIILPAITFSSNRNDIYVDAKVSGTQDGSSNHPYSNINEALKHANSRTDIHVANGNYKENFTIKKGVKIFGESKNGVMITAKNDNYAVARMKHNTTIDKVTLKGGKWGIEVDSDSKASIVKCIIKDNDQDGIHIEADSVDRVSISDSEIKNNGRAGIYSKKRKLSIVDNDIFGNRKDGISLEAGAEAWIDDNNVKNNGGSGLKLKIDGSAIWTKNNTFRNNSREGLEVVFAGKAGRIDIKKSSFINNGRYGIARVQDLPINAGTSNLWAKYLTFQGKNPIFDNEGGSISPIIVRN